MLIILASSSPRRKEMLDSIGLYVENLSPSYNERSPLLKESSHHYVMRMALLKALSVCSDAPNDSVIIAADTVIDINSTILRKPIDRKEANAFLNLLKNKKHCVITGLAVIHQQRCKNFLINSSTDVYMRNYSQSEINEYLNTEHYLDKSGAYAIQSKIFNPVNKIHGCYSSVLGLPLCKLDLILNEIGLTADYSTDVEQFMYCYQCVLKNK